jgi:AcrR family transcriptional regulator
MSLDTRVRILNSAMELFAAKGYAGTSIDEVLRKARARNPAACTTSFPARKTC